MATKETKITPRKPAATVAKSNGTKVEAKSAPAKAAPKKEEPKKGGKKIYHVSKRDNNGREWKVFIQGSEKVIKLFGTQVEALDYAKNLAKNDGNATVMLHGLDGKIRKA